MPSIPQRQILEDRIVRLDARRHESLSLLDDGDKRFDALAAHRTANLADPC